MTLSATRTIEIDASVEEVFAFVADPRRRTQAMARALGRRVVVSNVETSPEGAVTGWEWSSRFVLPIDYTAKATRAEYVVNQRIVDKYQTATKDVDEITLEPTETGTLLTWQATLSSPIPLLESVAIRMTAKGRSYGRQIEDILAEIKRELEVSRDDKPVKPTP